HLGVFLEAKKIEMGERGRGVSFFHNPAARAARVCAIRDCRVFDADLAPAGGIGAMPMIFCLHLHERSLARRVSRVFTSKCVNYILLVNTNASILFESSGKWGSGLSRASKALNS